MKQGAGGILINRSGDQILLVRGLKEGKWGPPKGHKENHERHWECALREIREETGLVLDCPVIPPSIDINGYTFYLMQIEQDQNLTVLDQREICDVGWWPIDDLPAESNSFLKQIHRKRPTIRKIIGLDT